MYYGSEEALAILSTDPKNHSQQHHIKKPKGVDRGEGQYRVRLLWDGSLLKYY